MKKLIRPAALLLLAAALLAGCLQTNTLVKVNRDGSGTVEETFVLSDTFLEMMKQMGMDPGAGGQAADGQEPDRQKLEEKAARMGEGVQLVSVEPLRTDRGSGYRAVYRFADINRVHINQNPSEDLAASIPSPDGEQEPPELLSFVFTRGNPSRLEILAPRNMEPDAEEAEEEPDGEQGAEDAGMAEMMRQIYQDMRIGLALEVQGSIVGTNASYRDGSRITLIDMDFAQIMQDEAQFKKLSAAEPKTLEETKQLLEGVPGLKMELQERVEVRFR